jgi:hypothetical protein
MFKSLQIKSNHRVLRKNKVHTYGAPVLTPDHNTTVLEAKMCKLQGAFYVSYISLEVPK